MRAVGALIIGNEILSGRRQDKHLQHTVDLCARYGAVLEEVVVVRDRPKRLVDAFRRLARDYIVLSYGGIGATPDDYTRQAVAEAFSVPLVRHPEGFQLLKKKYGADFTPARQKLVDFPQGACLIPNPINQVPAFSLFDVHCFPGFPDMAAPMSEWVFAKYYERCEAPLYKALLLDAFESEVVVLMDLLMLRFPSLSVSSLPKLDKGLELGFEGKAEIVHSALDVARDWCVAQGIAAMDLV